ncbi:MAG: GIDE domain-containing protein [bacterium]
MKYYFELIMLIIGASIAGIYSFFDGLKKMKKRMMENIPTSKIRSLALGLVELSGKAEARNKPLQGPLSGKDCVFCKYSIERWERRGKSHSWAKVVEGGSYDIPFYIQDETGKVLIDPRTAEINFREIDFNLETNKNFPPNLITLMERNNIKYKNKLFLFNPNYKMRFKEWNIFEGDLIYVLGTAKKAV